MHSRDPRRPCQELPGRPLFISICRSPNTPAPSPPPRPHRPLAGAVHDADFVGDVILGPGGIEVRCHDPRHWPPDKAHQLRQRRLGAAPGEGAAAAGAAQLPRRLAQARGGGAVHASAHQPRVGCCCDEVRAAGLPVQAAANGGRCALAALKAAGAGLLPPRLQGVGGQVWGGCLPRERRPAAGRGVRAAVPPRIKGRGPEGRGGGGQRRPGLLETGFGPGGGGGLGGGGLGGGKAGAGLLATKPSSCQILDRPRPQVAQPPPGPCHRRRRRGPASSRPLGRRAPPATSPGRKGSITAHPS